MLRDNAAQSMAKKKVLPAYEKEIMEIPNISVKTAFDNF